MTFPFEQKLSEINSRAVEIGILSEGENLGQKILEAFVDTLDPNDCVEATVATFPEEARALVRERMNYPF